VELHVLRFHRATNLDKRTHWWNLTSSSSIQQLTWISGHTGGTSRPPVPLTLTFLFLYFQTALCHSVPVSAQACHSNTLASWWLPRSHFSIHFHLHLPTKSKKITKWLWNYINFSMKVMPPSIFILNRAPGSFLPYPPESDSDQLHRDHQCSIQ